MHRTLTALCAAATLAAGVPAVACAAEPDTATAPAASDSNAPVGEWKVGTDYISNERLGLTDSSGAITALYLETPRWNGFSAYGWVQLGEHALAREFDPAITWQRGEDGKNVHALVVAYFNAGDRPIYSANVGTEFPLGPVTALADIQGYAGPTFPNTVVSLGARRTFELASWFKPTIELGKAWNAYEHRQPVYGRFALPLTEHVTLQFRGYHVKPRGQPTETKVMAELLFEFDPLHLFRR